MHSELRVQSLEYIQSHRVPTHEELVEEVMEELDRQDEMPLSYPEAFPAD